MDVFAALELRLPNRTVWSFRVCLPRIEKNPGWDSNVLEASRRGEAALGLGCGCRGSWEPLCRAARSGATQALGG